MNAYGAYEKALKIGPNKELENIIVKHPYYSYYYAKNILHGKFEKGENAIAKNSYYSYWYAKDVLHNRFKKGEKTILNSEHADSYKLIISIFENETKKLALLNMNHEEEDVRKACKWMLE